MINWYNKAINKAVKLANGQYHYITNCTQADGNDIEEMVDNAMQVTYKTFRHHVPLSEIKGVFGDIYDYQDKNNGIGLRIQNDYAVSFYKSKYQGRPCYYIYHSAIEYVFVKES